MKRALKEWLGMKETYERLWPPHLEMRINYTPYASKGCDCERTWITSGDEVIWDFPEPFYYGPSSTTYLPGGIYKGFGDGQDQCRPLLRRYLDTPRKELLNVPCDVWGLTDILKVADRRLGQNKLVWWALVTDGISPIARKVLRKRFCQIRDL